MLEGEDAAALADKLLNIDSKVNRSDSNLFYRQASTIALVTSGLFIE